MVSWRGGWLQSLLIVACASLITSGLTACRENRPAADRSTAKAAPDRPNVLLIVIDTVRADRLSAYGYQKNTSPFLEELARRGTRFENAYAQGLWTRSAIPTLLTSTYVSEHGNVSQAPPIQQLPSCEPNLVEVFRRNGYDTAAFTGTLLPGSLYDAWGWTRGFDYVNVDWYAREAHAREYPKKEPRTHRQLDVNIVRDFADWLIERKTNRPFFAYIHLLGGHGPYETPDSYALKFIEPELRNRFLEQFGHSYQWDPARAADHPAEVEYLSAAYDAALKFTDRNLRYLVEELEQRALRDKTVVAIVADHGENLLENGLQYAWLHGGPNPPRQPLARIPLVLAGPNVPPGSVVTEDVMQIDVAPTLISLAGLSVPEAMRGLNILDQGPLRQRQGAIIESDFFHKIRAVVMGRWKYTRAVPDANLVYSAASGVAGETLVDLESDPDERHDISALHPDQTRRMRNLLATRVNAGASGWHVRVRGTGTPERYEVRVRARGDVRWVALFYDHPELPMDRKVVASSSILTVPQPVRVGNKGLTLRSAVAAPPAAAYVFGAFVHSGSGSSQVRMWLQNNSAGAVETHVGPSTDWRLVWGYTPGPLSGPLTLEVRAEGSGEVSIKDAFISPAPDSFGWESLTDRKNLRIPFVLAEGTMDVNVQFIDEPAPVTIEVRKGGNLMDLNRLWIAKAATVQNPVMIRPSDAFWPSRSVHPVVSRVVDAEIYYSGLCGGTFSPRDARIESEAVKRLRALGYLQ